MWAQFDRGNSKNTGRDLPNSLAPINTKAIGLTTNSKSVMKAKTSPDVLIDSNRIPPSFWVTYSQGADFKKIYDENRNNASSDREAAYFLHGILRNCAHITFGGKDKARERLLVGKFSRDIENMRRATFERVWNQCAGFENVPSETISDEMKSLESIGEQNGNLQFAARKMARIARGKDVNDAGLDTQVMTLLETRDPAVLWELSSFAASRPTLKKIAGDIGIPTQEVLSKAWAMAACDAGYDCQNIVLPGFCIANGICAASDYAEAVRLSVLSPIDYEMANQIRLKIADALRANEWSRLGFNIHQ